MLVRVSDDVLYREVAGEMVLLNLKSGIYFGLDDVGARMWSLVAQHGDTDKVVPLLLDEFEVDETTLRGDLHGLIQRLHNNGLVVIGS